MIDKLSRLQFKIDTHESSWWSWAVSFLSIVVALLWGPGYYVVLFIYAIQVLYYIITEYSPLAFPFQIRIAYFAIACLGIIDTIRLPMILLLLVATARVMLLGRCSIASILKHMPWNRNEELRLN